jgi:hypothetical protein
LAWFFIVERQAIHRGSFILVKDLDAKIRVIITCWNDGAHRFLYTKDARFVYKETRTEA